MWPHIYSHHLEAACGVLSTGDPQTRAIRHTILIGLSGQSDKQMLFLPHYCQMHDLLL